MTKIPPKWKKMIHMWDNVFGRARLDEFGIQCMFADTPFGCHGLGECRFKHDHLYSKDGLIDKFETLTLATKINKKVFH